MYTPGMIRHTIEELRNLGYTAEQARFIIRNCGTGAGGFQEGNDCAKGKAGKDGDGDGEFEGDKGGGGGKKGGGGDGGKGGKPRQTEGTSEEVSGERAEMQKILDDAPRAREVRKEIEETKKKIKNLRASQKKNPDREKVREEKAAIKKLFALEDEAKGLPSEYDIELAMAWEEETDPLPVDSDGLPGTPLQPLFTEDELKAAEAAMDSESDGPPPSQPFWDREMSRLPKEQKELLEKQEKKASRPPKSGKSRKKRSFSHRLMELRKAGLPISVAIRMSREDGDD
jgi:hypothetical protein